MLLKYLGSILPAQECENRVVAIVWSPNSLRLAVASSDRCIYLFDDRGVKKDRFSTKPVDPKHGKKSYLIKGIAFSPDSTKIAVGQTDNIVYVYRIGEDWGEKKVICNKFSQPVAVTCLIWPSEGPIVVGLADGKVRAAMLKANKSHTLYSAASMTISLAVNIKGTGFLSGHADGSIIRYYVAEDSQAEPQGRVLTHGVPAYALAWPAGHIFAAGCDKRIFFYDQRGKPVRNFDYSRDKGERELTVACCSPSGQSVAVGSWDKIRLLDWTPRKGIWEEANTRALPHLYTVTAMTWRKDGSRLMVGGLCGAIEQFESILRRTIVRGSHEVAYVGPSQVVVRPLNSTNRPIVIRSQTGNEIEDVRVLGRKDNHIVARTSTTLLVSDIESNLLSEIPWEDKGGREKFFLEYPGVCLIFCAGELTIIEYGHGEILGSVRTEAVNPHVVSIRVNERQGLGLPNNKRLAYLLDPRTVCIMDLTTSTTICITVHDAKVDWLELSETGHRLLSRDRKGGLWLSDDKGTRTLLLAGASFASWVPGSDVVVAQTGTTLAVWYNVDSPEAATLIPIKGDAVDIVRNNKHTRVMVEESGGQIGYILDEGLIEFGTALHDNDFGRVILYLEELGDRPQAEAMWENVARNAMAAKQFYMAARCYAALGDVAYSDFLTEIVEDGKAYAFETGNDALVNPDCWAKIAILNGELKIAEAIYLEQNELDKALEMYQKYWHWGDALTLAQSRAWNGLQTLRDDHLTWLLDSGQAAQAAAIIESFNPRHAVTLYLQANRPGRAARLMLTNEDLMDDPSAIGEVISALKAADLMELAGEVFEKSSDPVNAIKCYSQAGVFARALELARKVEPNSVVNLEREWGHHLAAAGHFDAAINHFIESGETALALNAAIKAHQWRKALQIVQVIENDSPEIQKQCARLGEYFASIGDRETAETLLLRAGQAERAIEAHINSGNWARAHRVAMNHMNSDEANQVLGKHAEALEQAGNLRQAESLYIAINQYDLAIAMYRREGHRGDMVRLVREHRPDLLQATHAHLARELEAAGKLRDAEEHFLGNGDWRGAVAAYKAANMWEDALRVAEQASGEKAGQQVALMWAQTLAPELGARLLMRLGYFEPCLQLACEANLFDWVLEIVKYGNCDQKKEVYYKHAMALEDEGRFSEAENEFVQAGKAMEAVQMYIHTRDWDAAEEVAKSHYPDGLAQVLVSRAADAAKAQDYALAESLLLRAHKPEIIVNHYKNAGMWSEAMRVCREYLPSQEAALRRELNQASSGIEAGSKNGTFEEARRWLEAGEVRAALDVLILDPEAPKAALVQAADILINQADFDIAFQVGEDLGARLFALGEYALAAQVFIQADKLKSAVDALASVGEWGRAKRVVKELAPELDPYLEVKYKEAMLIRVNGIKYLSRRVHKVHNCSINMSHNELLNS
ncbi:intraflagellar transport protein 172 homolog isoform X2 [Athalia rosae]|uniref:intraflagellar transport protein 172 homolog isoform X2 n=1 Tax=Athalia rosae TaxID=37344 RepID=UPI00203365F8|nr:intraflagellar transport protein 172 homolog isoform X2 [Athalia rosae]